MNKKALSPLIATIILVVFALVVGAITMSWGKSYVGGISEEETKTEDIVIDPNYIDTELKELQLDYITGKITLGKYLEEENKLKREGRLN